MSKDQTIEEVSSVMRALSRCRFSLSNEKELQTEISKKFEELGFDEIKREHRLDCDSVVDFFYQGVAIEVKIKGSAKAIYRQCERYCQIKEVNALILVTNKAMGFPEEIHDKPCYVINLGKAWF